jgi:Tfp pilus assembly protein PilO
VNRRSPLIAGAGLAVVAILAIVLLVLPKMGQVSEAQDQLTQSQDQEATLQAQLGALQDAQAEAPETEQQIAEIDEQVPPTADLPELFRLLQNAADTSAVDFFAFAPGSPTPDLSGQFSVIPAQVTVTGSYFAIDQYLFLMETLPRAAKVTGLTLSPISTSTDQGSLTPQGSLQMLMSIEFYTTDSSAGPGSVPGPTAPSGTTGSVAGPTGTTGSTTTSDGGAA